MLLLVNAAFAGTELAVVSLRRSQLRRLGEDGGRRGRTLAKLADDPTSFLSTIQVGITLAGFMASATAAVSLAEPLEPALGFAGDAAGGLALVTVTLILTFLTLVFGELVPKRVAMRHSERWALAAARPVELTARAARPVIWLLSRTTDVIARMLGGGGSDRLMTEEEVRDVIASETDFTPARRALVTAVLELDERTLHQVLTPRRDMLVVDAALSSDEAARVLARDGHSRAPVAEGGDLDDLVGIVGLARLVAAGSDAVETAGSLAQEALVLPDEAHVQDALLLMQRERRQLALVADEHGRVVGMVTVEDLLEEIVGEIYDEYDRDLSPSDPRGLRQGADGSYQLQGTFPLHDLPDLGFVVPDDVDASTIGGLLFEVLGELPAVGDHVTVGSMRIEASEVEGNAVIGVRLRRA